MVSHVYDRIADSYDDDWNGLYAESTRRAVAQIVPEFDRATELNVVDLAVGTGNTLNALYSCLHVARATGFDVSSGMLSKAAKKLPDEARLIHDSAANAEDHLEPGSLDLVLCFFLLRYLEPEVVLPIAYRLLQPGGCFALVSSTQRSLMECHSGRFERSSRVLRMRSQVTKGGNPADHAQSQGLLRRYGFDIVTDNLYREPVTFHSFDDVEAWAFHSGWAAEVFDSYYNLRVVGARLVFGLAELFYRPLYPVDATNEISIVLARKPA